MVITNLTGTTWVFGEKLLADWSKAFEYSVNFSCVIEAEYTGIFGLRSPIVGTGTVFKNTVDRGNYYFLGFSAEKNDNSIQNLGHTYYGYNKASSIGSEYKTNFTGTYVTFTGGTDITNTALIEWLLANATLMASVFDLSTLNLPAGTHSITVKARAEGYADSDESEAVQYVVEEPVSMINFTIDGTSYQAEEGMNWGDWVDSDYNTGSFSLHHTGDATIVNADGLIVSYSGEDVHAPESIVSGRAYITVSDAITYLTFETEDGSDFTINTDSGILASSWDGTMEYSTDTRTWQTWEPGSTISSANGKLYVRGTGNTKVCNYDNGAGGGGAID